MTEEERRKRRLDTHRKYNQSRKGIKRNKNYEARNPSRKLRWEPAREAVRRNGNES